MSLGNPVSKSGVGVEIQRNPVSVHGGKSGVMVGNPVSVHHSWEIRAGSPRVMAHPGLPQIQTCRLPASGSSSHDFAAQLKGLWTTRALGRPYRSSSRSKSDHERGLPRRRRDSHRFQICRAPRRKFWRLAMLPMIP